MARIIKAFGVALGVALVMVAMSSCGLLNRGSLTRGTAYPKMYEEHPTAILIMPPINKTNKVEAKESVYATLYMPLVNKGYYVFSPFLSQELLQSESGYDAEQFIDGSLTPFLNVYGADAVLFTTITRWNKLSALSQIEVAIEYTLKSTRTHEVLFHRSANVTIDASVISNSGSLLLDFIVNTVATALTDNVVGARKANAFILQDLPEGKYSPLYLNDKEEAAGNPNVEAFTVR